MSLQCSATCGSGFITRSVSCHRIEPPSRESRPLPDYQCTAERPPERKPCDAGITCPSQGQVNPDGSNYVQLQSRRVRLSAGGQATLIPGEELRVRCPVSGGERSQIQWTRDGTPISRSRRSRVFVSRGGMLQFKSTEMHDHGVYTCHLGGLMTSLALRFHTPNTARTLYTARNAVRRNASDFIRRARQQNRQGELTEPALRRLFSAHELPYTFLTSPWDACTQSCGGAGFQSRAVTCELNFETYYLIVNKENCFSRGLSSPLAKRDCGFGMCPYWDVGQEGTVSTVYVP